MIRKFEINDLDNILDIWLNENISTHNFIKEEYWKNNLTFVRKALPFCEVFVFEEDNLIKGFVGVSKNYIQGIFVKNEFQSLGIGSVLLDYLKQNKEFLTLKVYEKNIKAINFYLSKGFITIKEDVDLNTKQKELLMKWENKI